MSHYDSLGRCLSQVSMTQADESDMSLPQDGTSVHRTLTPQQYWYSFSQPEASGIKCIAQVHNTVDRPGIKLGASCSQVGLLTTKPVGRLKIFNWFYYIPTKFELLNMNIITITVRIQLRLRWSLNSIKVEVITEFN